MRQTRFEPMVQRPAQQVATADVEFDPIRDLFIAQSDRPPDLGEANLRALTPFQRALLVIDGTVTKFIEAYMMEVVDVVQLAQSTHNLPADHLWLAAPAGTEVIAREVLLQGRDSYRVYGYARSLIIPGRLPAGFVERLSVGAKGIGGALLSSGLESVREILWYGRERPQQLPAALSHLKHAELLSRTYRVIASRQPIMFINEKFPLGEDTLPDHH